MQKHYGKKRKYRDQVKIIVIFSNIVLVLNFGIFCSPRSRNFSVMESSHSYLLFCLLVFDCHMGGNKNLKLS